MPERADVNILPWYVRWLAMVALCAAFGGWCYVHGMQHTQAAWDAEKAVQQAAALKAEQANRAKELALHQQVIEAQNEAKKRETKLAADAAAARAESGRLRDQLATANRKLSTASADAIRQYAATLSDVFEDCAARYTAVAGKADEHGSDVKTLEQAWPK